MVTAAPDNEFNVYEAAEARFEVAAKRLGLEEGLYRYMKYPNKEITVYIPVTLDNGHMEVFIGYRVHHSIVSRAVQGRHPLRSQRDARRSPRTFGLDDVEMRRR